MHWDKTWSRVPRGVRIDPYPLLVSGRTPAGWWRLSNPFVVMLADVTHGSGAAAHYGRGWEDFTEESPPMPQGYY